MKPRTHYFKFQARFVLDVLDEKKRCTIRAKRKGKPVPAEPGDRVVLECWQGLPYRSKVERLGEAVLKHAFPVQIEAWEDRKEGIKIIFDGVELIGPEAVTLATDDGFKDLQDFADFFRTRLPFTGTFYEWHNP